jgi:hypothetical protein
MSRDGKGGPKDAAEAIRWFRLAADQGVALAQFNLGLMYANGLGPRDYVQADMWLSLAEAQGTPDARKNRELVERAMTSAQTAEARELARNWKPKPGP